MLIDTVRKLFQVAVSSFSVISILLTVFAIATPWWTYVNSNLFPYYVFRYRGLLYIPCGASLDTTCIYFGPDTSPEFSITLVLVSISVIVCSFSLLLQFTMKFDVSICSIVVCILNITTFVASFMGVFIFRSGIMEMNDRSAKEEYKQTLTLSISWHAAMVACVSAFIASVFSIFVPFLRMSTATVYKVNHPEIASKPKKKSKNVKTTTVTPIPNP